MLDKVNSPFYNHRQEQTDRLLELWRNSELILDIAFVNNMPDAAFEAVERQFMSLLLRGAAPFRVKMHRFMFPEKRVNTKLSLFDLERYKSTDDIAEASVDAIVVTGSEPIESDLIMEGYWNSLAKLVNWAENNTISSLWSCLAAHAAVLCLDGIQRRPLGEKQSGVFPCDVLIEHALVSGLPKQLNVPHSRRNELDETDLICHGYQTLTRSTEAGIDIFIKKLNSLFVFLQGHPEYSHRSLLLEYKRDLRRYVTGVRPSPPEIPKHYFDTETELRLIRAGDDKGALQAMIAFPEGAASPWKMKTTDWLHWPRHFFLNWLYLIASEKLEARDTRSREFISTFNT